MNRRKWEEREAQKDKGLERRGTTETTRWKKEEEREK